MSFPNIKNDKFQKKINRKFGKYTIPKKKKTFKQICYPKEYKLQKPQQFVGQYINPKTPYKGLLLFHKIGSGKTCSSISIAEQWKKHRKIIVVVPASLIGNYFDELRTPCAGNAYITQPERHILANHHPLDAEYRAVIKRSNIRINKHYQIISYNKFVSLYEDDQMKLRNTLLIIDEVQNMVSEKGKFYTALYNAIHEAPASLRTVLLSATPMFDKPVELALTMNLLRLPFELPTGNEFNKMFIKTTTSRRGNVTKTAKNLDIFKERVRGYISYYRGAPPYAFPDSEIRYVKSKMSPFQYKSYLAVLEKEQKQGKYGFRSGQITKLPNNFFIGTRVISNIAFPNKDINEDGYDSLTNHHMKIPNLKKYSIKFYKIMKKIKRASGTIFIYSNFKEYGGLKTLVKILESHGYSNYKDYGEGKSRFAVWSGDEKNSLKDEIKAVFNNPNNMKGNKIKIILGSPSIAEGVSLKRVQQVHVLEPYWNHSKLMQIIGRAIRYCSHKDVPLEKRLVKVYIYLATYDNEYTVDQYIRQLANNKNKLIQEFATAMKEIAVDCTLFKNANVFRGEKKLTCDI